MCMIFDRDTHPQGGYTASEDIVCYKVLTKDFYGNYCSIYNYYVWKLGRTYQEHICVVPNGVYEIVDFWKDVCIRETQYVSKQEYATLENNVRYLESFQEYVIKNDVRVYEDLGIIQNGFYSYTRYMNCEMEKMLKRGNSFCIEPHYVCKFVIPKGSRYYVSNDTNVYVSNALRFVGIVGEHIGCAA